MAKCYSYRYNYRDQNYAKNDTTNRIYEINNASQKKKK